MIGDTKKPLSWRWREESSLTFCSFRLSEGCTLDLHLVAWNVASLSAVPCWESSLLILWHYSLSAEHLAQSRQFLTIFLSLKICFKPIDFTWGLPWCCWVKVGSLTPLHSLYRWFDYSAQHLHEIWEPGFCAQLNTELKAQRGTSIIKIGPFHTIRSLRKHFLAS